MYVNCIYEAKREGVLLKVVQSKNTSRQCPKYWYIDKRNRNKNQFECLTCHYTEMADYVAALNIAEVTVNQPTYGSTTFYGSCKPSCFSENEL
jgi:transposase